MPPRSRRNSAEQHSAPADAEREEIIPETPQATPLDCTIRIRPPVPGRGTPATQPAELPSHRSAFGALSTPAVTYGHFNERDPMFYIRSTVSQLKSFIATAPENFRSRLPATATKDTLLEEIFRLREEENRSTADSQQARQALFKLMSMTAEDITRLVSTNSAELKSLMTSALAADATLKPRDLNDLEPNHLEMTLLTWQLEALKQAHAVVDQSPPPPPRVTFNLPDQNTVQQSRATPPPTNVTPHENGQINTRQQSLIDATHNPVTSGPQPRDVSALSTLLQAADARPSSRTRESQQPLSDSSDEDILRSGRKKRKSAITPTFSYGVQASQSNLIRTYPGKGISSSSLHIDNLWGPSVLCSMIAGGMDIPTFLAQFQHWKRLTNGSPSHDEIEAHTIGRAIHVEMLEHDSPKEAIETRPSIEILLRRLYALLYVAEEVSKNGTQKGAAWKHKNYLHESLPRGTIMCDELNEDMTGRMGLEKKRLAALQAMHDRKASTNRSKGSNNDTHSGNTPNRPPTPRRNSGLGN